MDKRKSALICGIIYGVLFGAITFASASCIGFLFGVLGVSMLNDVSKEYPVIKVTESTVQSIAVWVKAIVILLTIGAGLALGYERYKNELKEGRK